MARIKNRKTRGSEFSETEFQLKKLKEDIDIEDYEIEKYENIYEEDLKKSYARQIREKIENEEYSKKNFWRGILAGALIGFILGFFINLLYDLIKFWLI